jgi:hypothetical protein
VILSEFEENIFILKLVIRYKIYYIYSLSNFDAIGCGDQVYLFVGAAPKNSPSRVMQIIKSITARKFSKNTLKLENSFEVGNFGVMEGTCHYETNVSKNPQKTNLE